MNFVARAVYQSQSILIASVVPLQLQKDCADLLALGEYAIALPHAKIVYYGSRSQIRHQITYEFALSLASEIKETNELAARKLVQKIFPRIRANSD